MAHNTFIFALLDRVHTKSVLFIIYIFLIFSSCSENNTKTQKEVQTNNEIKINPHNYSFNKIIISDWNNNTTEFLKFYTINGENNDQPMKMIWDSTNNGKYRELLLDSLYKQFHNLNLRGSTIIKETFVKKLRPLSNTPNVIYIINKFAKFHATIHNITFDNKKINFDIDTSIRNEIYYNEIPKRFFGYPTALKVFSTYSDHGKCEVLDIYSSLSDNGNNVLFDFEIIK